MLFALALLGLPVAAARGNLPPGQRPQRYVIHYADDSTTTGNALSYYLGWRHGHSSPTIDKQPIFKQGTSIRMVRDLHQKVSPAAPFVEFVNGDRLPATLAGIRPADRARGHPQCFELLLGDTIEAAQNQQRSTHAVRVNAVARLVSALPEKGHHRPGTLCLADGQIVETKAVRWKPTGAKVLTADKVMTVPLETIKEWYAPAEKLERTPTAHMQKVRPGKNEHVVRFLLTDGTRLTALESRIVGQPDYDTRLFIQPYWAITSIAIRRAEIVAVHYLPLNEIPLSLLPATTLEEKSFVGHAWTWRRDANVRGGMLHSGERTSLLGVGTHSYSAVAFDLPETASRFNAWVGLDRTVGEGGCVRCALFGNDLNTQPLWQKDFLCGSDKPANIKSIPVEGMKRLVLLTDYAHEGRPQHADPLDIRDEVDWLDAAVTLKPTRPPAPSVSLKLPWVDDWDLPDESRQLLRTAEEWNSHQKSWRQVLKMGRGEPLPPSPVAQSRAPGLNYKYYPDIKEYDIPDLNKKKPTSSGVIPQVSLSIPDRTAEYFCARYESALLVPHEGIYEITLCSDDGSRLYLDNELIINNGGLHAVQTMHRRLWLKPGPHRFRVDYIQSTSVAKLEVLWRGPGIPEQVIPTSAFDRSTDLPMVPLNPSYKSAHAQKDRHILKFTKKVNVTTPSTWLEMETSRDESGFGGISMMVSVDGKPLVPLLDRRSSRFGIYSFQPLAKTWYLGEFLGQVVELELAVRFYVNHENNDPPGLCFDKLNVFQSGNAGKKVPGSQKYAGTWSLKAATSRINNHLHSGSLHGGRAALSIADDGGLSIIVRYPRGGEQIALGSYSIEDGRMKLNYSDPTWRMDVAEFAENGRELRVMEWGRPELWSLDFTREPPVTPPDLMGEWILNADASVVINRTNQGRFNGGSGRLSFGEDGSFCVLMNYPQGGQSLGTGMVSTRDGAIHFEYDDKQTWRKDTGTLSGDKKTLNVKADEDESKWNLVFSKR
jgi:hypothetical protein